MNKIKVVFLGTPNYALSVLKSLYSLKNVEILAVVSQPNKKQGRNHSKVLDTPTANFAKNKNILLFQPNKVIEIEQDLIKLNPDLVITAAYGKIIPESMLNSIADKKWFNLHASLLPKYRGGSPISKAIENQDTKTGVTLMIMEKEMDSGDMIDKLETKISISENLETLTLKLQDLAAKLITKNITNLYNGSYHQTKQDLNKVSFANNIKKEDCLINWNLSSEKIDCKIRSTYPKEYAYTFLDKKEIKILNIEIFKSKSDCFDLNQNLKLKPGAIFINDKKLFARTKNGFIEIKKLMISGKKETDAASFINGYKKQIEKISKFN